MGVKVCATRTTRMAWLEPPICRRRDAGFRRS